MLLDIVVENIKNFQCVSRKLKFSRIDPIEVGHWFPSSLRTFKLKVSIFSSPTFNLSNLWISSCYYHYDKLKLSVESRLFQSKLKALVNYFGF